MAGAHDQASGVIPTGQDVLIRHQDPSAILLLLLLLLDVMYGHVGQAATSSPGFAAWPLNLMGAHRQVVGIALMTLVKVILLLLAPHFAELDVRHNHYLSQISVEGLGEKDWASPLQL
jgi:hypothetical protein